MANVQLSTLGGVIKTAYESQADTNAFTDVEKTKLAGIPDGGGSGIDVQEEGVETVTATGTLNFVGSAVTVTDVGGVATITVAGGAGVATAGDLGFAMTGDPLDGDDGAVLALLMNAIETAGHSPVRIQFTQDNITAQTLRMYVNSSISIPSNIDIDFGGIEIILGANGRIRIQGSEDEIRPGDRVTPTPTGSLARIQSAISPGATTLELDNTDPSSAPGLFSVGEYIVLRGENDAGGNAIEKDVVRITDITGFIVTFEPALEFGYAVDYPGSLSPSLPDRTTISIRATFITEGDILATNDTVRVSAGALVAFGPGDWVELEDDVFVADATPDTPSQNKIRTEILQVKSVDAAPGLETITFTRGVLSDYTTANATVITKIVPAQNSSIRNARITFAEAQASRNNHPTELIYAVNSTIENVHVERNWTGGFAVIANSHRIISSVGCVIKNCSTLSPLDPPGSGEGYGATIYYSYGCRIEGYLAQGCRHSLLLQGASRNIITNFTSHDCSISDIDFHGINERENVVSNFTVVGGPSESTGVTSRTGIKFGNTFHLFGSHDNIVENGVIRLGDTGSITTRGIEILPDSTGNVVRNVKILDCQHGVLMTDLARTSDTIGPDQALTMERNTITDIIIENSTDYAIRIVSNNANAGANTTRTIDDLVLRNIECRNCSGGVLLEQTNQVRIDNITFIDQTGATSAYAMRLLDNTNLVVRGVTIANGDNGIYLLDCPAALIDDVLFDLTGTRALDDQGGNTGASVTEMKFRSTTATHSLTSTFTITGITDASPAVVTVASTTGLTSGDLVSISGIVGTMGDTSVTGLNGKTYTVNVLNGTTFELLGTNTVGLVYTSGGTATQLTQSSFRALTNSVRRSNRVLANILPDTTVTDATSITNDATTSPTTSMGTQIISATFTPTAPATTLDIEVVVPSIFTSLANSKQMLTLFDGSTCIGVAQANIDTSGATNTDSMRLRVLHPITGYTPRTLTARFGPRDGQTVTLTLFARHRNNRLLSQPFMIINDLGVV